MKWLKSTTQKTYLIDGKKIPACVTPNNDYLALSDDAYTRLKQNKVIASLIEGGAIIVTDVEPMSPTKQASVLTQEKALLIKENTELKEKLKAAEDNSAMRAELDSVTAELKESQKKYKALEKEAKETIANLNSEIAELKAQLGQE